MADLRCSACDKYLGDNNDLITSGPHAGARPTDLTVFCDATGKQEPVVDRQAGSGRHSGWWAKLMRATIPKHGERLK